MAPSLKSVIVQGHCWFGKHPALSCRTPVGQPWISNQPALGHFHCRVHARQGSVPELTLQQQPRQLPATNCRQRLCSQLHCVAAETDIAEASTAADQYSSHLGVPELQHSSTAPVSQPDVTIKLVETAEELQAVAQLRADAYYAEDHSRFAQSFKRQFAAQEVESLRQRTSSSSGRPQLCECLVAVQPSFGGAIGCIDIRLPQTVTGMRAIGVPDSDAGGCYLLNVVVADDLRGQGVGKALMRAAMARAVHAWGAQRLYTHVEADNEVACGLYKSCGFQEHSSEAAYAQTLALGRLVLLMAGAADVPALEETLWSAAE